MMTRWLGIALAVGCWNSAQSSTPPTYVKLHYQWDGCPAKYQQKINETVRGGAFPQDAEGSVRCCSDTDDTCESNVNGCKKVGWLEAKQACESANRRLCTLSELQADTCCGSGCDYDWMTAVWTSTEATVRIIRNACGDPNTTYVPDTNTALTVCFNLADDAFAKCPQQDLQFGQAEACCKTMSDNTGKTWVLPTALDIDKTTSGDDACTAVGTGHPLAYVWTSTTYDGASAFVALDGCKTRNYGNNAASSGGKDYYYNTFERHATRCCSFDGGECITPTQWGGCEGGNTWWEAQAACSQIGMRLCKKSEVDDMKCCESGCMFDVDKVWTQTVNYIYRGTQKNETGDSCNYKADLNAADTGDHAVVCCGYDKTCVDPVPGVCTKATLGDAQLKCAEIGMEICRDTRMCSRCKNTKCYLDGEIIPAYKSYIS